MNIKILIKKSYKNARDKGFWNQKRNLGELLMLIVSELGEALEANRKERIANEKEVNELIYKQDFISSDDFIKCFESQIKDTFQDEIADVFIRLEDLCGGLNIDIEKYIELKMKYNSTRKKLHGKKY